MTLLHIAFLLLTFNAATPTTFGPQRHELWQTGRSLVASIRVASLTSVFSPAVCLSKCLEKDCTLMTLAVTSSSSGERLDCHLTNVTNWLTNADVYLEPCKQTSQISCNTFVTTRILHFYFPLDGGNQLRNFGTFRQSDKNKPTLRYSLGSQSGNPFTCTGPTGKPHVKYLLNNLDTNNYLIINLNVQWQPTAGFTLAIWVMFLGPNTVGPMFEFYRNDQFAFADIDRHFRFWNNPGQLYYANPIANWHSAYVPVKSMNSSQWHHVAMTWRPGGELVFYWNASQIYSTANAEVSMAGFQPYNLLIGARPTTNELLRACLAHANVLNEAMSQSQLQHLMMTQWALP